ncbi:DUF4369 domain-containing protein [Lutibacter holmesii]|uniref:DUF4369 domain-containing protein n=1 Tax=Lutibacter holmesii TaxID=1137985 RepID=A0ABW3WJ98_9FLAO
MKNIIGCYFSIFFILFSCNSTQKKPIQANETTAVANFALNGTLTSYLADKVYLNKIDEDSFYPIDSAAITNNKFIFEGAVDFPERFALTFENYSAIIVFILENTNFQIEINPQLIHEPSIKGSALNVQLNEYKTHSKNIFKKIDYLFPQFQKARLENNAIKLDEIGKKMKRIEAEFRTFSFTFIKNNPNSYVSGMILRDQLKATTLDTLQIINTYKSLSSKVKKAPDAQIIEQTLVISH